MNSENAMFFKKHPYLFALFVIIIFIVITSLVSIIEVILGLTNLTTVTNYYDNYISTFISQIVITLSLIAIAWKFRFFDNTFFSKKNLKTGIILIIPLIIIGILWNVVPELMTIDMSLFRIDIAIILLSLIANLSIGFTEEIMCRGLIFKNFLNHYCSSKKSVYLAMIISSLIFGILHLFNAGSAGLDAVIQQVIYAFCAGLLFSAIYLTTGNLLICCIGHGLFDFTSEVIPGFFNVPLVLTSIDSELLLNMIVAIILIVYTIIIIKKYNVEDSPLIKKF